MPDAGPPEAELAARVARIEALTEGLGRHPDEDVAQGVRELVGCLLDLQERALLRILTLCGGLGTVGDTVADRMQADPLLASLLVLHDLHPLTLRERVEAAIESMRPYLGSHGGDAEVVDITDDGVLELRLKGSCDGCPSSRVTVRLGIEEAVMAAAPEIRRVVVVDATAATTIAASGFVPLDAVAPAARWRNLPRPVLEPGRAHVRDVEGCRLLLCELDGSLYCYEDACGQCGASLAAAALAGNALTCGACDRAFDLVHAGRGIDHVAHLRPLPLLEANGHLRLALPVAAG